MEEFIYMVRQLPCLWDTESREYRDLRKKHYAWKKIVENLKWKDIPDIATAKAEWKKLRDSHRDALKRSKVSSNGQDSFSKWKYAEMMEFLLPYMKTRLKRGNTTSSDEKESSLSPDPFTGVEPSTSQIETINIKTEPDNNNTETLQTDHEFKRIKLENDNISETMANNNMDEKHSNSGESSRHPLDLFFDSMCESTKQFPTWLQYSVKRKIFNVIAEAEDTFETYKSDQVTKSIY